MGLWGSNYSNAQFSKPINIYIYTLYHVLVHTHNTHPIPQEYILVTSAPPLSLGGAQISLTESAVMSVASSGPSGRAGLSKQYKEN